MWRILMKKLLLIAGLGAILAGCAQLTQEQIKNADYGQYPTNYERIVKEYYETVAKHPDSLKYKEISTPEKSWGNDFGAHKFGYMSCVTVNGKNSYGAYVGYETDGILIKNGKVIHIINNIDQYNRDFCKK